jgi:hypothetical protein
MIVPVVNLIPLYVDTCKIALRNAPSEINPFCFPLHRTYKGRTLEAECCLVYLFVCDLWHRRDRRSSPWKRRGVPTQYVRKPVRCADQHVKSPCSKPWVPIFSPCPCRLTFSLGRRLETSSFSMASTFRIARCPSTRYITPRRAVLPDSILCHDMPFCVWCEFRHACNVHSANLLTRGRRRRTSTAS